MAVLFSKSVSYRLIGVNRETVSGGWCLFCRAARGRWSSMSSAVEPCSMFISRGTAGELKGAYSSSITQFLQRQDQCVRYLQPSLSCLTYRVQLHHGHCVLYWKPDKQSKDDVCVAKRNCLRIQAVGMADISSITTQVSFIHHQLGGKCRRRKMSQAFDVSSTSVLQQLQMK